MLNLFLTLIAIHTYICWFVSTGDAIGNLSKVPYKKINQKREWKVTGWPINIPFRTPGSCGVETLKCILANMDHIKFER